MITNNIGPSFTSRNIYILGNYGINKKNPYLFNKMQDIMKNFQTTVIYNTGKKEINIPSASDELVAKLLTSDIILHEKQGKKLKLLI